MEKLVTQGANQTGSNFLLNTESEHISNESPSTPLVLTAEQKLRMTQRAARGIVRTLGAQAVMGVVVAAVAWAVGGHTAALSALLGAAVYWVPNALFALRLLMRLFSGKTATVGAFFIGEMLKLGTALVLLVGVAWLDTGWLVWLAFLAGLLGVLKGYVLLLALGKLP